MEFAVYVYYIYSPTLKMYTRSTAIVRYIFIIIINNNIVGVVKTSFRDSMQFWSWTQWLPIGFWTCAYVRRVTLNYTRILYLLEDEVARWIIKILWPKEIEKKLQPPLNISLSLVAYSRWSCVNHYYHIMLSQKYDIVCTAPTSTSCEKRPTRVQTL